MTDTYNITQMNINGTIEWKILNIPIYSRKTFLEKISNCPASVSFWREQWIIRDEIVKRYVGEERAKFLQECCIESDLVVWTSIYNVIDNWKSHGRNEDGILL